MHHRRLLGLIPLLSMALTAALQPAPAGAAATGLRISGAHLTLNGTAFLPRGFNMIGALSPAWCDQSSGVAAHDHLNAAEMTAAASWHANTLRFQVSQEGLGSSAHAGAQRTAYLAEIRSAVQLAEAHGFMVILSMQDQSIGCGAANELPSAETETAWRALAPAFASDSHVMYELFNEPQNGDSAADWAQWRNGGTGPVSRNDNGGNTPVGFQQLVTTIRATGADNPLLADGALYAEHLNGVPILSDTAAGHGIGYAVHPYYFTPGSAYWAASYGYLTTSHVVIATEWDYLASDCSGAAPGLAPAFLNYLTAHNIGITAHAFDVIGTQIANWKYTPTACGSAVGGSGSVLKSHYAKVAG